MTAKTMININGHNYPCMLTLGAMSAYRQETGEEVSQLQTENMASLAILLYCCTKSACRREKVDFPYNSYEEMADYILVEDMPKMIEGLFGASSEESDQQTKKNL